MKQLCNSLAISLVILCSIYDDSQARDVTFLCQLAGLLQPGTRAMPYVTVPDKVNPIQFCRRVDSGCERSPGCLDNLSIVCVPDDPSLPAITTYWNTQAKKFTAYVDPSFAGAARVQKSMEVCDREHIWQ
jgi:hypothetical protein